MAGCYKVQIRYVSGSKKNLVQYRGTFKVQLPLLFYHSPILNQFFLSQVSLQSLANDNNEILCWSKSSGRVAHGVDFKWCDAKKGTKEDGFISFRFKLSQKAAVFLCSIKLWRKPNEFENYFKSDPITHSGFMFQGRKLPVSIEGEEDDPLQMGGDFTFRLIQNQI